MGDEFGQTSEWNYKSELQWELLEHDPHRKLQQCVKDLNALYRDHPAMHEHQFNPAGFEWGDLSHRDECVISFKRKCGKPKEEMLVLLNMTPVPRHNWEVYVHG